MAWYDDLGIKPNTPEYYAALRDRLKQRTPTDQQKYQQVKDSWRDYEVFLGRKEPRQPQVSVARAVPQGEVPAVDSTTVTQKLEAMRGGGTEAPVFSRMDSPEADAARLTKGEFTVSGTSSNNQTFTDPAMNEPFKPRGTGIFSGGKEIMAGDKDPFTGYVYEGRPEPTTAQPTAPSLPIGTERPKLLPGQVYLPGRGVGDSPGGQARRDELRTDAYAAIAAPASELGGMENARANDALMRAEITRLEGGRGAEVFTPFAERNREEAERQARTGRNLESFRNALLGPESFPTMTATQIGDKREMDRRKAQIETMEEGPAKQDALAALQDEETAKRQSGLKDSDRFEGSKGSPDWKERQGRMAAYEQKLKSLQDGRVITKREAEQKAKEMKLFEQRDEEIAIKRQEVENAKALMEQRNQILGLEVTERQKKDLQNKQNGVIALELEKAGMTPEDARESILVLNRGKDRLRLVDPTAAEALDGLPEEKLKGVVRALNNAMKSNMKETEAVDLVFEIFGLPVVGKLKSAAKNKKKK
jgi:hypothetical protein